MIQLQIIMPDGEQEKFQMIDIVTENGDGYYMTRMTQRECPLMIGGLRNMMSIHL